ncbi:MAG: hypothetical protein HYT89_00615 [Candidatus Omnitrophica bacterium]|nr:hypothetical protein [Candidatus Omnitrophota bacterium]
MSRVFLTVLAVCFSFAGSGLWAGENEEADYKVQTLKTKEGMQFRIPEDMPIETKGGVLAPASTEEYIYVKFKQLDKRLKTIEDKIDQVTKIVLATAGEKYKETPDEKSKVLTSR